MRDFPMTINGRPVGAKSSFDVLNPATEEVCGQAPDCQPDQLNDAFDAAVSAFPGWSADAGRRQGVMRDAARALRAAAGDIAPVLTAEQGKPLPEAAGEIEGLAAKLEFFAGTDFAQLSPEVIQDDAEAYVEVVARPLGVVSAIAPWNFPLSTIDGKLPAALRVGNTVVLKPSPYTPLSSLLMGQVLQDVLPPGVLNVVSGGADLGGQMVVHPVPRMISFTGSVRTGEAVRAGASSGMKRVTLELGGNDAAILLDDVALDDIIDRLFWRVFANNGQICTAIKRIYAPAAVHDDLVERMARLASDVVVGNGTDPVTQLGPVNNRAQFDRITALVADARERGAVAAAGGGPRAGRGYFYPPTILAGCEAGFPIVDEEQFGPAVPIIKYEDADDAVRQANGTEYGLGGSVWSSDPARAWEYAKRLECGTAWVNTHRENRPYQPLGGLKSSGIGKENGRWGIAEMVDVQAIRLSRA